jgi:hypothetical protein
MYIRKCDRCGAEEQVKSTIPFFVAPKAEEARKPKFSICKPGDFTEIYLCPACEDDLEDWMTGYGTKLPLSSR